MTSSCSRAHAKTQPDATDMFLDALVEEEFESGMEGEADLLGGTSVRRFGRFECNATDLAQVRAALGRPVTAPALRGALLTSMQRGARMGRAAAVAARPPRTTANRLRFNGAFSASPDAVPSWRPARSSWRDLGELVALRFRRASEVLDGGWIRVFCWHTAANCPECATSAGANIYACSSYQGRYRICLGGHFYRCMRNGNARLMASTFLHEALHIYFARAVGHAASPLVDADAYESFAVQVDGGTSIYC